MRANDGVVDLHGGYANAHFTGNDVPRRLRLLAAMTGVKCHRCCSSIAGRQRLFSSCID